MSLRRLVVDLIRDRGCGTVDHLMPKLEALGYTRLQAIKALHNARNHGFLWCEGRASRRGVRPGDIRPAVYWPGQHTPDPMYAQLVAKPKGPERVLVASVFELGAPKPESAWPKGWDGTVHRPLGAWNGEEAADMSDILTRAPAHLEG